MHGTDYLRAILSSVTWIFSSNDLLNASLSRMKWAGSTFLSIEPFLVTRKHSRPNVLSRPLEQIAVPK